MQEQPVLAVREPDEVRASRTVLREARGEIPLAYSPSQPSSRRAAKDLHYIDLVL